MCKLAILLFVLLISLTASSAEYLDTGLGKSLLFEPLKQFAFHEGRDYCHSTGGDLWIPDNDQELDWFQRRFPETNEHRTIKWIGLIKMQFMNNDQGKLQWIDGRRFWADDIPNLEIKDLCKSSCCAYRLGSRLPGEKVQFWAEKCDLRRPVVCEKKDIPKNITFVETPQLGKSFHYDANVLLSFYASIAYCVKNGGKLWHPSSEEETLYIVRDIVKKDEKSLVKDFKKRVWIGAYKLIPLNNYYYSFDGKKIDQKLVEQSTFSNPFCKAQCCAQFVNHLDIVRHPTTCKIKLGVVCERPMVRTKEEATTKASTIATTEAPTAITTEATTRKTVIDDNDTGGKTKETKDNRHIVELLGKLANQLDIIDEKISEQTNDFNVKLTQSNERMDQILVRLATISDFTANGNRNQNFTCSPGGNCYFANNAKRTFNEARLYCLESGGRLPTLNARDEQIWFAETFQERSDVWLGAKHDEGSANYRFLDGSELINSNSNWKRGAKECAANCCAVMSHYPYGEWIGEDCSKSADITICEKLS